MAEAEGGGRSQKFENCKVMYFYCSCVLFLFYRAEGGAPNELPKDSGKLTSRRNDVTPVLNKQFLSQ